MNRDSASFTSIKWQISKDNGKNGQIISSLETDKLDKAIYFAEDMMERISNLPFMLAQQTANCVYERIPLIGDGIDLLVLAKEFTRKRLNIMKTREFEHAVGKVVWTKEGFTLYYNDVPVRVKIIKDTFDFFKSPDLRFYGITDFWLPNPFDKYWENKDLVK